MALVVTHGFSSGIADDPVASAAGEVLPSHWNANHTLTGVVTPSQGGLGVANNDASTITISGNFATTITVSASSSVTFPTSGLLAALNVASQTLSGGAVVTSSDQGTASTGTYTASPGLRPLQYLVNGGAFTLAAPANDGSMILFITNNASAGAITFSGFTVGSSTGDALTTTNTHKFSIHIWRVNGTSGYRIAAHQ